MHAVGPPLTGRHDHARHSQIAMLRILGRNANFCDGVDRRSFLQVGGLALGGLSLVDLLRAESQGARSLANSGQSSKSVIMILLPGGPPHLDMFDLKPEAPVEIRGEFRSISTQVPGIRICELFPRMAAIMDKLVVVRSLHGGRNDHNLHQCLTGWETHPQQGDSAAVPGYPAGGWPSIGAVASHVLGPVRPSVPAFVSLAPPNVESTTRASLNQSGLLGMRHAGFEPLRNKRQESPNRAGRDNRHAATYAKATSDSDMVLQGITLDRLGDRRQLLASLDQFRREAERGRQMSEMDAIAGQAMRILTSSDLARALDISAEDLDVRRRYGVPNVPTPEHGGPELLRQFLMARRLIEAGVRCVTLAFSPWPLERESRGGFNWDWHTGNFAKARQAFPMLDLGLTALIEDLSARGMLDDVAIVVWGEFGRSPRINRSAGRDHWPNVGTALLAGGGLRTGQVLGSTDRYGEFPEDRPVHYREVFATLYHHLGITARHMTVTDRRGRPHFLVDGYHPLPELV